MVTSSGFVERFGDRLGLAAGLLDRQAERLAVDGLGVAEPELDAADVVRAGGDPGVDHPADHADVVQGDEHLVGGHVAGDAGLLRLGLRPRLGLRVGVARVQVDALGPDLALVDSEPADRLEHGGPALGIAVGGLRGGGGGGLDGEGDDGLIRCPPDRPLGVDVDGAGLRARAAGPRPSRPRGRTRRGSGRRG